MKRVFFCIIFLSAILTSEILSAQGFYTIRRDRLYIASVGGGLASYFGDLNNPGDILDLTGNVNLGLQRKLSDRVNIRGELMYYRIKGDDSEADSDGEERDLRNLDFFSDNFEFSVTGMVHAFPQGRKFYQRNMVNFYGFLGVGFTYFNPKTEFEGETYALQPLETEGVSYNRVTLVIPVGGGVKVKMGPFFNIVGEVGYRKTFTDYLDDVSTVYPDPAIFGDDDIARALSDRRSISGEPGDVRGNPDNDDAYFIYTVKLEYYLPHDFFFNMKNGKRKGARRRTNRPKGR